MFETFEPKLSDAAKHCDVLFLANIQPDLQRGVREQCAGARFVAMDSMDLWINIAHDSLVQTIKGTDCLILNDEELELLTGKPNFVSAAREVLSWGLTAVVAKQGKYGAALFTADGVFALPAYPLEDVVDPTGAGDSFAGGLMGYLTRVDSLAHPQMRRAIYFGSALGSFCVEGIGPRRLFDVSQGDLKKRMEQFMGLVETGGPIGLPS